MRALCQLEFQLMVFTYTTMRYTDDAYERVHLPKSESIRKTKCKLVWRSHQLAFEFLASASSCPLLA